jgi:Type II secretion system protein B
MTNREKIIVGLMLLTVVYGIYTVFFESKGNVEPAAAISSTKELEGLNAFITKVAEASKAGLSDPDKYIIARAEAEWKQDPLVSAELTNRPESEIQKSKAAPKAVIPNLKVSYTGFMQMGDRRLAIINGVEYSAGDELEQGGYVVRSITPSQVVIVSTGDSKQRFIFPLEE